MESPRKKHTGEAGNGGEFGLPVTREAEVQLVPPEPSANTSGIRIGELSGELGIPIKTLRRMADNGEIPSSRTGGGHRVFDLDSIRSVLTGELPQATIVPQRPPDWQGKFTLDGLDEADVWVGAVSELEFDRQSEGGRIASYGFTEMLNNAIDHSGGTTAMVEVWLSRSEISFRVIDDGEGVFAHLREGLGLDRVIDAAGELTKGKRTTWSERHSGEGIFFTSKAVGMFRISANGFRITVDNARDDTGLGISRIDSGSVVEMSIPLPPPRTLRSVFEMFTDEHQRFSKSRPAVKLFGSGVSFVSRSEGRRVMDGMTGFEDIDIDFAGVEDVGQGFVDEVLRVWPSQNPSVRVNPINMNDAVQFMVRRALPKPY